MERVKMSNFKHNVKFHLAGQKLDKCVVSKIKNFLKSPYVATFRPSTLSAEPRISTYAAKIDVRSTNILAFNYK